MELNILIQNYKVLAPSILQYHLDMLDASSVRKRDKYTTAPIQLYKYHLAKYIAELQKAHFHYQRISNSSYSTNFKFVLLPTTIQMPNLKGNSNLPTQVSSY